MLPNHWLRPPLARASSNRLDALTPDGNEPGSDPVFMKTEHLDKHGIAHAVLSSIQAGKLAALPNAGEALALATAFNEFFLAEFLAIDDRYKLAMVVAAHDPVASAAEIRRLGPLPGVVAVFLPLLNIMMGNRHYYPLYEAAEELGLPIPIHPTGTEGGFPTGVAFAGGTPSTYVERHTDFPQIGMSAITSLVFEGVFARFPRLMVLAAEFGFSWLPHVLWRMDQNWRQFRKEVPWVTRLPSEIVLDHVRFTSQPIKEPEKPAQTVKLANNLLVAAAMTVTAEALVMGVKAGVDPKVMLEVINASSGRNTATADKFPRAVLTGSFDFGFTTGLLFKDVRLCLDAAEALGVPTPVGAAIRQALAVTNALYGGESDFTSVVRPIEAWAGVEVRSK